jgi:hypothetical protein
MWSCHTQYSGTAHLLGSSTRLPFLLDGLAASYEYAESDREVLLMTVSNSHWDQQLRLLLLLLLLHGPGRNLEHPFGEPNAAHGVITS